MKNWRLAGIVFAALLASSAVFALCYWAASRTCLSVAGQPADELAWLGTEFRLTDADLASIRLLHDGYKPKCEQMCARIAAKNRELAELLASTTNVSSEVDQKLREAALLRAECQAQMLRHFEEVARTMPAKQGMRYLAEMRRVTLGLRPAAEDPMGSTIHEHP